MQQHRHFSVDGGLTFRKRSIQVEYDKLFHEGSSGGSK
jgi:hypothetical protein